MSTAYRAGDWLRSEHGVFEITELYDSHGHTPEGPAVYPTMKLRAVLLQTQAYRCECCGAKQPRKIGLPREFDRPAVHPANSPFLAKLSDHQRRDVQREIAYVEAHP